MGATDEREYIGDLKVKYGDSASEAPPDALRELTGLSNSINHGYGGKHVWLVPTYTRDPSAAATSFHVVAQANPENKMDDLAKGAGGGYRYIFSKSDNDEPSKIVYAVLQRTQSAVNSPPAGWDMMTADINKGRRKSRLYILFKTTAEPSRSLLSIPN
ncbi:hypothetical protein BC835DRAFT_428914 [Cytidiella melzeri]|nr:hypothetical protein BC835DRAFT_428914 [Cytidiella melzeri]